MCNKCAFNVQLTLEWLKCPQKVRVEHKICSTMYVWDTYTSYSDFKKSIRLAGGSGKVKICPRNGLSLDSKPSRSPQMGQGPPKWSQINQGQWGRPLGVQLGAYGGLQSQTEVISWADFNLPWPPAANPVKLLWSEIDTTTERYIFRLTFLSPKRQS